MPVIVSANCPEYILLFIPRNNSIIILASFTDDKADFSSLSSLAQLTELVSGSQESNPDLSVSKPGFWNSKGQKPRDNKIISRTNSISKMEKCP